jgi:hypothetical protein
VKDYASIINAVKPQKQTALYKVLGALYSLGAFITPVTTDEVTRTILLQFGQKGMLANLSANLTRLKKYVRRENLECPYRLSLSREQFQDRGTGRHESRRDVAETTELPPARDSDAIADLDSDDDSDGINPVAQKWLRRNGISTKGLETIFSIAGDEIDLISESVPGGNKKSRMKSVALLANAAAYLASGAARITDEKLREALRHYDAYDPTNFASYLKDLAAEVTGTKENGYTLTPRGLAGAATLLKEITKKTGK